jgi:KDO2-lipid IV(A) lauroyltransferase
VVITRIQTLILKLLGALPLGLVRLIAKLVALPLFFLPNDLRRICQINLQIAAPNPNRQQAKAQLRKTIESSILTAFEMPVVWQHSNNWLNKKILAMENASLLNDALQHQQGVIAICPHVGNWEVFGRKLPQFGATTNLYQPPKYTAMETLVRAGREKSGATLVPTNQRGVAALLKALRRGEIIGILPDQVPKNNSALFVDFFGQPAFTMTLVHSLIKKTHCKVVLGYALRFRNGFKIIFKEAPLSIYSSDEYESVSALSQMVEMATEEAIEQYQWGYKRYKKQPDGSRPY